MRWRKIGEIVGGDVKDGILDHQQAAISHDGNRVVLGAARGEIPATLKIFDFNGIRWEKMGNFSGRGEERFGCSIALSGNGSRLAIEAGVSNESDENSGCVRTYECVHGKKWKTIGRTLTGLEPGDWFGDSISMSEDGSRIAIGAPTSSLNGDDSGSVRIFEYDGDFLKGMVQMIVGEADYGALILEFLGDNWKQIGQTLVGESAGNFFGSSVSLSADGNIVAVGAPESQENGVGSGSVRTFQYSPIRRTKQKTEDDQWAQSMQNNGHWVQAGEKLLGGSSNEFFGWSLSIHSKGDVLAVSAPWAENDDGYIKVFKFDNNKWNPMGKAIIGKNQNVFGYSVCLASNTLRIAEGPDDESAKYVQVFDYDGKDWVELGDIIPPASEMSCGTFVSLSSYGDRLAVGSIYSNGTSKKGQLNVYEFS